MKQKNFKLVSGDTKSFNLTFMRSGVVLDITGHSISLALSLPGGPVLTKTVTDHLSPTEGKSQVSLQANDTAGFVGPYNYSIRILDSSQRVTTVLRGRMFFVKA